MSYPFPPFAGSVGRPLPWSATDIIALICQSGFMSPDDWRPITFAAVTLAESAGDPLARGQVIWAPGQPTHLSQDLGMFQLNSHYHTVTGPYPDVPPITAADCFDPHTSWAQAWKVLNKERTGWSYNMGPWTVYRSGAYNRHVTACYHAMIEYREIMGLGKGPF